jgi:hypothetical protein
MLAGRGREAGLSVLEAGAVVPIDEERSTLEPGVEGSLDGSQPSMPATVERLSRLAKGVAEDMVGAEGVIGEVVDAGSEVIVAEEGMSGDTTLFRFEMWMTEGDGDADAEFAPLIFASHCPRTRSTDLLPAE